jgi:hypothetical protein
VTRRLIYLDPWVDFAAIVFGPLTVLIEGDVEIGACC